MVDEDPEVVNMMLEYMYLLDYFPPTRSSSSRRTSQDSISDTVTRTGSKGHDSDTMSIRTDAVAFGHAVTAFGGPREDPLITPIPDSPFTLPFRRTLPDATDFSSAMHRSQHPLTRAHSTPAPEISPLATPEAHLSFHARAYAAGERYGIAGLKALALDKYKIQLTRHWDHPEFPESIHIVYSSTPASDTDMRGVVADTVDWHSRLFNKPEIEVAVMEINGLAYELLKRSRRTLDRD